MNIIIPFDPDVKYDPDVVTLTCPGCGGVFKMPRWQYKIDMEEEDDDWQPSCPACCGEDVP